MKQQQKVSKQFIPVKSYYDDDGTHHVVYPNFQKVIKTEPLSEKIGQIQLKILFKQKNRNPVTFFGYSYFQDLSDSKQYKDSKVTAFKQAYKQVPFSPDSFEIIGEKFIYIDSANSPLYENSIYRNVE